MLDLKDLIVYASKTQLEAHKHIEPSPSSIAARLKDQEAHVNMLLQKSLLKNAELERALMDSITDSVADGLLGKDTDVLRRHGQTFMEALMRRSKVQSAHRKALKVYIKWRNRYGNLKVEPETAEKLTRQEVSTIIRSSRILHFCRAPLIFCDPEKDWRSVSQGQATQAIVDWYVKMANSLITEYATYLEGADMQLLEFAKSEDDEAERVMKSSEFVVGKQLTASCSPVYLLSVFEGGSIICEVRLTGIFLSVTLYSLHRQYGRLDYRRFHPETRNKKRENFRKFEENCGRFKQLIHINSFVYDFHIRYFSRALEAPETLPSDFDIVFFMRRFSQPDHPPPPFCKDRLVHGMVHIKTSSVSLSTFFENLLKICTRSGWNSLLSRNSFLAASISCSNSSFNILEESNRDSETQWKYTLAISPGSKSMHTKRSDNHTEHDAVIKYFILVSNQEKLAPDSMARTSWYTKNNSSDKPEDMVVVKATEERYSLKNVISGAKAKIDSIAAEV
ncbi:hypothetical protein BCV72DRAFT_326166 [Rhizopus microsporus var. microsporus]|uniref:Uncharacterized protein n=1 Tax=Rhizopus microsporus var. microsporus TaxID=86635 RepID=A0A1X0RH70_RHIZD|nr:hypothetical protein BCV72DRAFT_326166 [Rhizopus microsporus var. microsporus]